MEELHRAPMPAPEPKVIKRYANRKLYDTHESRYVTLDEIAAMVKRGVEVQVVDNRSKDDLTTVTLAQILFEEEKKQNQMPLSLLKEIIRSPAGALNGVAIPLRPRSESPMEFANNMLQSSQRAWEDWQRRVNDRVQTVVDDLDVQTLQQRMHALETKIGELEAQLAEAHRAKAAYAASGTDPG